LTLFYNRPTLEVVNVRVLGGASSEILRLPVAAGTSNEWLKGIFSLVAMMSILIADDDARLRQGLRNLLEEHADWHVVGEAANGREALEKAVQLTPEVVILDVSMPELDGIGAARMIHQALPQAELVMFSQHDTPETVASALDAGVRGYVLKSQASRDLVPAVEAARQHASFLSPEVSGVRGGPVSEVRKEAAAGCGAGPSKNEIGN